MADRLKVLLITNLFPTPQDPTRGVFVYQMAKRLVAHCDVMILCPLPWFPRWPFLKFLKKWYPFSWFQKDMSLTESPSFVRNIP